MPAVQPSRARTALLPLGFLGFLDSLLGRAVAQDRVLGGLGDAELDHALGRDLDRGPGGGIAAHPRFAVDQNELADARQHEGVLRLRPLPLFQISIQVLLSS